MKLRTLLPAAALLLALSACDRSTPPPEADNQSEPVAEENVSEPEPLPPAPPPPPTADSNSAAPVAEAPPPPEPTPPDEQMREDAEATGMTARIPRDDTEPADAPPAENRTDR